MNDENKRDMEKPYSEMTGHENRHVKKARCGSYTTCLIAQSGYLKGEIVNWEFVESLNRLGAWMFDNCVKLYAGVRTIKLDIPSDPNPPDPAAVLHRVEVLTVEALLKGEL